MTTRLTIGRLGTQHDLPAPQVWSTSDGKIEARGWINADTAAESRFLRDTVRGLWSNADEPVVPVTVAHDPTLDGWYRVDSVAVPDDPDVTETTFNRQYAVSLQRTEQQAPLVEALLDVAVLTNDHSLDLTSSGTATPSWAVPDDAYSVRYGDLSPSGTRTADSGDVYVYTTVGALARSNVRAAKPTFLLDAADAYDGACTIEADVTEDGAGWAAVTGRTTTHRAGRVADSGTTVRSLWRFGNGLVRVSGYRAIAGYSLLQVEHYDGTNWEVTNVVSVNPNGSSGLDGANLIGGTFEIVRNSPETIAGRIRFASSAVLELVLRRGQRNVLGRVMDVNGDTQDWYVSSSSGTATTALQGGIRLTSNDANGNRYTMYSPADFTSPNGGDLEIVSAATSMRFGLGCEVGGSAATGINTAAQEEMQFYAAVGEIQRVAGL